MPRLMTPEDLNRVRDRARGSLTTRLDTPITVVVTMGDCGLTAGARETLHALLDGLALRGIAAHVAVADCTGDCAQAPRVEIRQVGQPSVTYANVRSDLVPSLIEVHLGRQSPQKVLHPIATPEEE
jgi:NADP-reducing hydrogenase subunit HndB